MNDFVYVIIKIYSSTPLINRGFRDVIVNVAYKHIKTLLKKSNFFYIFKKTVDFKINIVRFMARGIRFIFNKYKCLNCGNL